MTSGDAKTIPDALREGWETIHDEKVLQRMIPIYHMVRFVDKLYHQENGPEILQNGGRALIDTGILWYGTREGRSLNLNDRALAILAPHATEEEVTRTKELMVNVTEREFTPTEWVLMTEVRISGGAVAENWRQVGTLAGEEKGDYLRSYLDFAKIGRDTLVDVVKAMRQFRVKPSKPPEE